MNYNWAEYYQKAYEAEKKRNTVLAGKVADAEGKREELQAKYAAICANPLYRLSRFPSLFTRGYRKIRHTASVLLRGERKREEVPEAFTASYWERLNSQRDSYGEWIREEEPALWEKYREALGRGKENKQRRCLVIPYRSLAGVRNLSEIIESMEGVGEENGIGKDGIEENSIKENGMDEKGARGGVGPNILLFADHPGEFDERAVSFIENWFSAYPNTKLLYGAEDHRSGERRCFPWFKPCWSPDTLLGFFYFGSYFAVDRAWAEQVSLSGSKDAKCNLYDFVLQLSKRYFQKPAVVAYDKENIWQTGFYYVESDEGLAGNRLTSQSKVLSESGIPSDSREQAGVNEISVKSEGLLSAGMGSPEIVCLDLVLYHRESEEDFEMPADREYYLETGRMRKDANPEFWGFEKEYIELKQAFMGSMGVGCFCCQTLHPDVWSVVPERVSDGEAGNISHNESTAVSASTSEDGSEDMTDNVSGSMLENTSNDGSEGMPKGASGSITSGISDDTSDNMGNAPLVSAVILSKDHPELLQNCITSFLERTFLPDLYRRVEFIVVDNGSNGENRQTIQGFLESIKAEYRYIYRPMEFNFSAMCNAGVREARGEYILLLNDDVEIIERNWLRVMLGQALLPGTGAVGAKLWYPEGERIQHAGVTNMHIGPSHKLTTFPDDRTYYYGHNTVTYNMTAVTAACLLVRRSAYEEAGGLDEEMAVAYNDVDFCFRLAEAGYRNVLRNDAVLLHHESASRGIDDLSEEKWLRLIREKTSLYDKHPLFHKFDPYYSEQLTDNAPDYHIGYHYPYERLLATVTPEKKEGKGELQRILSGAVMLTVERAGKQHKIYLEEPDIVEAEGWCYMLWQDNCLFERWLVLEPEQGDYYYRIPVKERLRPDVEEILPQQKNIALSGFVCRVLRKDIVSGEYRIGMLYRSMCDGKMYCQSSDVRVEIGG